MVVTPLRFTGWCRAVSKVVKNSRQDVRSPAKALGHSAAVEVKGAKKRVLSAAGRAAIAKAARKRWAKVRKEAKKKAA
jgi:hypothetical protein